MFIAVPEAIIYVRPSGLEQLASNLLVVGQPKCQVLSTNLQVRTIFFWQKSRNSNLVHDFLKSSAHFSHGTQASQCHPLTPGRYLGLISEPCFANLGGLSPNTNYEQIITIFCHSSPIHSTYSRSTKLRQLLNLSER